MSDPFSSKESPVSNRALRQFAGAWLVVFLVLGAHQYLARGHQQRGLALMVLAAVIGVPGLIKPGAVRWLFEGWMVLAYPIGWLVTQVMLALMFYGVITPVAVLFRLKGRDPLCRKLDAEKTSYWTDKETPQDPRTYFRQY